MDYVTCCPESLCGAHALVSQVMGLLAARSLGWIPLPFISAKENHTSRKVTSLFVWQPPSKHWLIIVYEELRSWSVSSGLCCNCFLAFPHAQFCFLLILHVLILGALPSCCLSICMSDLVSQEMSCTTKISLAQVSPLFFFFKLKYIWHTMLY